MATITRGATVLTPGLIVGWDLTRPGTSVVHDLIGTADVEITGRPPGRYRGDLRTFWTSRAAAAAAADALAVSGGAWTWAVDGASLVASVVGAIRLAAEDEAGTVWSVTVGVQEVGA